MRDVERFARDAVSPDVQPVREAIFGVIVLRSRASAVERAAYPLQGSRIDSKPLGNLANESRPNSRGPRAAGSGELNPICADVQSYS
jgi:hypothetical protein